MATVWLGKTAARRFLLYGQGSSSVLEPDLAVRAYPTSNGGAQNESSVGICTHCPTHVFFACSAPICMLDRCLVTKTSASEFRRKFITGLLLVG